MRTQQQDAPGRERIVRGSVTSAGAVQAGVGFTVQKTATGTYVLQFPVTVTSLVLTSMLGSTIGWYCVLQGPKVTVATFNSVGGGAVDSSFTFIAAELMPA